MVLTLDNVTAAMSGKRLRDYDPADLTKAGEAVLKKAYILAGRDPQIFIQADELGKDMAGSFGRLTLAECELAAKAGVAGEIGSLKTPSYAAIMQWLEAYDKSPMVTDARKILRQRRETPIPVTEAEGLRREQMYMPECFRARWEGVRTTGSFPRHCIPHVSGQIYDWLKDEGVLDLPTEIRRDSLKKARAGLVKGSSLPIGDLEAGERLVISKAKHLSLEVWMRGMIERGERLNLPQVRRIY